MVSTKISLNLTRYQKVYHLAKKSKVNLKKYKANNNGINKIIKMGHSNPPILTANSYPNYLVFFSDLAYVKFNFCESVGRLKNLEIKLRVLVSCDIVGLLAA